MIEASGLFRVLGDDARLRLLRVLLTERLNVSELTAILGIAQSGVSRHLGLLRDAGLVRENRDGGFTYYQPSLNGADDRLGAVWSLLRQQFVAAQSVDVFRDDDARLHEVIRLRRERRETHGAATDDDSRQLVPGRSWAAWSRALGLLLPPLRVADLGCGDGYLTIEVAAWARDVVAVDCSKPVLARAAAVARRRGASNITWKHGDIDALPIDDASVDLALLSQTLHHAADPELVVREATRIIAGGGRVLALDLAPHDQDWVKERLGDRWLGFEGAKLGRMMSDAGLVDVAVRTAIDPAPFGVIVAVGTKPQRAVSPLVQRPRTSRSQSGVRW